MTNLNPESLKQIRPKNLADVIADKIIHGQLGETTNGLKIEEGRRSTANQIDSFQTNSGIYVHVTIKHGAAIPTDIDGARTLVHETGKIILTKEMDLRFIRIDQRGNQGIFGHHGERFLPKPRINILYTDLDDKRTVTDVHVYHGPHRNDYWSINDLESLARSRPNEYREAKSPFTYQEYLSACIESLQEVAQSMSERVDAKAAVVSDVRNAVKNINGVQLEVLLRRYRDNLILAMSSKYDSQALKKTKDLDPMSNGRERLFKRILSTAQRNTSHRPGDLNPYTFEQILKCIDREDLMEAFEKIEDPYLRVIEKDGRLFLRISAGKSHPETLGKTYNEATTWAIAEGLFLSKKADAHFDRESGDEEDVWIEGGLASGRIAQANYYHPEVGAHLSMDIPMDASRIGVLKRGWKRLFKNKPPSE